MTIVNVVALAARLQPLADDRLRLAADVARRPGRIDVGGVDRVEAGGDEAIEQVERRLGVAVQPNTLPPNTTGAIEIGAAETTLLHATNSLGFAFS